MTTVKAASTKKKLTNKQVAKLSDAFAALAKEVKNYRRRNSDELSEEEDDELRYARTDLMRASRRLRNLSIRIGIQDVAKAVDHVVEATREIDEFLSTVESIKTGVRAAAIIVSLAAAVSTSNAGGVIDAIKEFDELRG